MATDPSAVTTIARGHGETLDSVRAAAATNVQQSTEGHEDTALKKSSSDIAPARENVTADATPKESAGIADSTTGIVLHHLNNSRSQRILWLLEELGVPYSIEKYEQDEAMRAPPKLKDVHPLGKAPVLTDGDVTLAESGAIVAYLISKYGNNFLPTEAGKIDDLYFLHYAEGSIMPVIINKLLFTIYHHWGPAFLRPVLKPAFAAISKAVVDPALDAHCALLESHLEKSTTGWLAGCEHPTAADFMMVFPAEILVAKGFFAGHRTKQYLERIHRRLAYKRGLEKGGKYAYA